MKNYKKTLPEGSPSDIYSPLDGPGNGSQDQLFFENLEWLTTEETAVYLRKVSRSGVPQINTVHQMVCRGLLRRRKFGGRLYFRRRELDYLIENFTEGTTKGVFR